MNTWHEEHKDNLTLGERAADLLRNCMGSWGFIFGFLTFMVLWMGLNLMGWMYQWDRPPFILLNLGLSTLAGLQGGILLIAAKRQDAVASAMAKNDYEVNLASREEIRLLHAILLAQDETIKEIRDHIIDS